MKQKPKKRPPDLTEAIIAEQRGKPLTDVLGSYTGVPWDEWDEPVQDAQAASSAAEAALDMELDLTEGMNGVFSTIVQGDYAHYLVCVKQDTLLCFAMTNSHYLSLLREQLVVLEETADAEAPVQAPDAAIPAYLPYEFAVNGMGVTIENVKAAMSAMLSQGEIGVQWETPVDVDENYVCVTANLQALGCCVTVVYERESTDVVSVQWYEFLYAGTNNGDVYTATVEAGQTGAAVYTALLFAKCGLDMNEFGARVPELQNAFTELQSWLDAVSTEALHLENVFESSTLIMDSLLAIRMESAAVSKVGNVVLCCLTGIN